MFSDIVKPFIVNICAKYYSVPIFLHFGQDKKSNRHAINLHKKNTDIKQLKAALMTFSGH